MYLEKELREIVEIPSASSNINELNRCLEYCINFASANVDKDKIFIKKKEFNGIPSVLISNQNTMMFDIMSVGHIDVVPAKDEMFRARLDGSRLYGRGTADMKSGVLVALDILKDVVKANKNIAYGVLIVSDEEIGGSNGAKKWAELGLNSKILLDYDSGDGFDFISQKSKGVMAVEFEAHGIEAHGSMPWDGLDANDIIFDLINELKKIFESYSINKKPQDFWVSTMHVGIIKGGDTMNKIASSSTAVVDIRFTEKYKIKDITNIFDKIIKEKYPNNLTYKILSCGEAVFSDMNNKYFKRYYDMLEKEIGKKPILTTFNGATDMRYFVNNDNVIVHHNPNIGAIHSDTEFVDLAALKRLKDIGLKFVLDYNNQ